MMSNNPIRCQADTSSNPCSGQRIFPCLYHCKKMLCIQHLAEHERTIEQQIGIQEALRQSWHSYSSTFNELELIEQHERLRIKLFNYQSLKNIVQKLLMINQLEVSRVDRGVFERVIQIIQEAVEKENCSTLLDEINRKIESNSDDEESFHETTDESLHSASINADHESETIDSLPLLSNFNGNSPDVEQERIDDETRQSIDEDDYLKDSNTPEDNNQTFDQDQTKNTIDATPSRSIRASQIRGCCPLIRDGAFGIDSQRHGIRLCTNKSAENPKTCRLNEHFRRFHNLSPLASLTLSRAVAAGKDPTTTKLFDDHQIILNIGQLRTVTCPIHKRFVNHLSLSLSQYPCYENSQMRHLRAHLRLSHGFTIQAANLIVKAVKDDQPVHIIRFPHWINILQFQHTP